MRLSRRGRIRIVRWSVLIGGAFALEYVARAGLVRHSTLVPITEMLERLWKFIITGSIPAYFLADSSTTAHFLMTFGEIALSFALAGAAGLPMGILLWKYDLLARIVNPYLITYYAIPIFSLYPLLVALFGIGITPIIILGWLFSIVAIIINTTTGFRKVDEEVYPKVGRSLNLSRRQMFAWIYFPAATPYIFTGLKLGFIYALIGVIASEFIISTKGLGYLIDFTYNAFDIENMYASILLVIVIAVIINSLLIRVENRIYGRQLK